MLVKNSQYQQLIREQTDQGRYYVLPDGSRVPSVTTILDRTKPAAEAQQLHNWKSRVGADRAQAISAEAAGRGTRMHRWLEHWINTGTMPEPGSNPYSVQSRNMAHIIIQQLIQPHVTEFLATEVHLYYSHLYAGTTDAVAMWQGQLTVLDFKQTNRPKTTAQVHNYLAQLTAYALAHNHMLGTSIRQAAVLMCSADLQPQMWLITADEFDHWARIWAMRVQQYYQNLENVAM